MRFIKTALSIILAAAIIICSTFCIIAFAEEPLPKNASYIAGDATGDGIINSSDALAIINHVT